MKSDYIQEEMGERGKEIKINDETQIFGLDKEIERGIINEMEYRAGPDWER